MRHCRLVLIAGTTAVCMLFTMSVSAQVTYFDASVNNTVGATSGLVDWNDGNDVLNTNGTATADGKWRFRNDQGNNGIWEATGAVAGAEDGVELRTTISGVPDGTYEILLFYQSNTNWPIRAGFTSNPNMNPIFDETGALGTAGTNIVGSGLTFTGTTPAANAGEDLLFASLGQLAVTGGSFSVFVDDLPATAITPVSANNRSWYDGIGYRLPAQPSQYIDSVMTGSAFSGTTWSDAQPPSAGKKYRVVNTHTVNVDSAFPGNELVVATGGILNLSASAVDIPKLIVEAGGNLTESVTGNFALGDVSRGIANLREFLVQQDLTFNMDAGSDFFVDMKLDGPGNLTFNSNGAGSDLVLSAASGLEGAIRFNGTGDEVQLFENQAYNTLEMNSTGANRLVYTPTAQLTAGNLIFNQPGTVRHASGASASRLHGPLVLTANAAVTVDLSEPPSADERRFLITTELQGSGNVTVTGTASDPTSGGVTLNEFEIGNTGEPGTVPTDSFSGTITANDFVNLEIRHDLPNAGFIVNNNARLEMGHQAIPNTKSITFGEVTVNNGGTLDIGFEQGFGTATGGYTAGHHANDLILTDSGGRSGGLTLNDAATVRLQVNGTAGDQFDSITADGDVMLNGKLNVLLNPPGTTGASGSGTNPTYSPVVGDTFDIIKVTAGPAPVGDYDGSGTVDGGDYNFWRMNFGSNNAAADGNLNGIVDAADYVIWRKNEGATGGAGGTITGTFDAVEVTNATPGFGFEVLYSPSLVQLRVIAAGAGAGGAVPEPSTLLLVGVLLPLFAKRRAPRS